MSPWGLPGAPVVLGVLCQNVKGRPMAHHRVAIGTTIRLLTYYHDLSGHGRLGLSGV
jgi:hypothetical protein